MISAVEVYEAFRKAIGEEPAKALISYLEELEKKKTATSEELRQTELRLQKEIEKIRLEFRKEIEQVRLEFRKEIEQVRLEIERVKSSLIKWMFAFWAGQVLSIAALLRYFLP